MANVKGGPATPVSIVSDGTMGGPAIPVYGYLAGQVDRPVKGGPAIPVRVVTDAEIEAGVFVLVGDPSALPVVIADSGTPVVGGPAIPVYPVNDWPSTPTPPEPSTLLDGLLAYYKLNESSGAREDSASSNDLTVFGTVGAEAGIIGQAALFADGTSTLRSSGMIVDTSLDFTVDGWAKFDAVAMSRAVWGEGADFDNGVGLFMGTAYIVAELWGDGDNLPLTTTFTPIVDQWFYFRVWREGTTFGVSINNGAPVTAEIEISTGTAGDIFRMGKMGTRASMVGFLGALDEMGIWDRALTGDEATERFNDGDGNTHPFS